jgi:hypothetical protein
MPRLISAQCPPRFPPAPGELLSDNCWVLGSDATHTAAASNELKLDLIACLQPTTALTTDFHEARRNPATPQPAEWDPPRARADFCAIPRNPETEVRVQWHVVHNPAQQLHVIRLSTCGRDQPRACLWYECDQPRTYLVAHLVYVIGVCMRLSTSLEVQFHSQLSPIRASHNPSPIYTMFN